MKCQFLIFLVIIPVILFGQVGITFTFANDQLTSDSGVYYLEFDVMAKATDTGTKIGTGIVLINYNTLGFGENIQSNSKVTVTRGTLTTTVPPLYNIIVNDNLSNRLAITFEYTSSAGCGNSLPTTATQLVHVKIEIYDTQEMAGLFFAESLMDEQQYYDDNATKYDPVVASDELDVPLPVSLSSFTAMYINDNIVLQWTTQSETNNLGWNIYRSETNEISDAFQINSNIILGAGTTTEPTEYIYEDEHEIEYGETYWYWLESRGISGLTETYGPISITIPEEGDDPESPYLPTIYGLHQNYPNPFNPETTISYNLKKAGNVLLEIYDIKGRKIRTLVNEYQDIGHHKSIWNCEDDKQRIVSSGVYFYKLQVGNYSSVRKMILLK
jgi:hypothetical protein